EPVGRRRCGLEQEVVGVSRIPRHLDRGAAVPELCIHPDLELFQALRIDVRRTRRPADHSADVAADDGARERGVLLAEDRLVAGLAICAAQLELAPFT